MSEGEQPEWLPGLHTRPLTEDFPSDGDALLKVIDLAWKTPEQGDGGTFELDPWQRWLIRAVLERYPADHPDPRKAGQLRYRQCLVSMGRQNGKSVLGAVFGLYGLLIHGPGAEVVSVASTVDQANIIYKRVRHVIDNNPVLKKRFKTTGTRGIVSRDAKKPGSYVVKAGAESTLQGVTMSLCLYDEVHITQPETWQAVIFGTSARDNAMVLGITTAGDSNSKLLEGLYKTGKQAAAEDGDYDERFGFFLWEAPEHLPVTSPEAIKAANPAIACGRLDIEREINTLKTMPELQARRYRLNQFVAAETTWLPWSFWSRLEKGRMPEGRNDLVFSVDRSLNWTAATISASCKRDGKIYSEVVASLVNPDLDQLEKLCVDLWSNHSPMKFMMESATLKDLATRLRERGAPVEYLTSTQMLNVCATAYAIITEQRLVHADDPLVNSQINRGVSKNVAEGWRISRKDSVGDIDALLATIIGVYGAETCQPAAPLLVVV